MPTQDIKPLNLERQPNPVCIRHDDFPEHSSVGLHRHCCGQMTSVRTGVMELEIGGRKFISPPHYAIWIPPEMDHSSYQREAVKFHSIYIALEYCGALSDQPAVIPTNAVIESLILDFINRGVSYTDTEEDKRQALVVLDHFYRIPPIETYLPMAEDEKLRQVLEAIQQCPGNNDSLLMWAQKVFSTERTLSRRCYKELGMSFREWRQRLRLVKSIEMLADGVTVEQIALSLGYSTSSSFIAMFKRQMGVTPARYSADLLK
ncbi:MAG: AraC family transcriptional regulator [Endozoicomonas sp.]|uniref:AraC family transcriptional regulator n=1 Tax=Endozoicomonas sp. TaxID=1892382 RepID=UPI003D9B7D4A